MVQSASAILDVAGITAMPLKVTVCCATYNHRHYIRQALDSFLSQEIGCPVEILVHDDASTDGTSEIVESYAKAHADRITHVRQDENQYRIMPVIVPRFLFPRVTGAYVALCEGDDYWTNSRKLALQVEAMEQRPDVDLSFHRVAIVSGRGAPGKKSPSLAHGVHSIPFERILFGGGGFCPTPSVMIRSSVLGDIRRCVEKAPFGDKFIQIVGSMRGGAVYLPDIMAAYRTGHGSSWTRRVDNAAMLHRYEALIDPPYTWLLEHGPERFRRLFNYSQADQYAVLAAKYLKIGDDAAAERVLQRSAPLFREAGYFPGLADAVARRPLLRKSFLRLYPGFRAAYRWRALHGFAMKGRKPESP